jgi:beta-glucanase (GH16 family)
MVITICLKAQNPAVDKNWFTTPFFEDQFDNQSFFENTWLKGTPWGPVVSHDENLRNDSYDLPGNLVLSNGLLKCYDRYQPGEYEIWVSEDNPPHYDIMNAHYDYTSNLLFSKTNYTYGYFEMKVKTPLGSCFWPSFWLWTVSSSPPYIHEIDILEKYPGLSDFKFSTNMHWRDYITGNDRSDAKDIDISTLGYSQGLSETPNKFAVEWSPKWIYFYLNDRCIRIIANDDKVPNHPMAIISGFAIGPNQLPCGSNVNFPAVMDIDWVKIFHLNMSGCVSSNYSYSGDFTNYSWGVKKTVTINNASSIPIGGNVTIRDSDYTIINGNFTIPIGAEFSVLPTNCY